MTQAPPDRLDRIELSIDKLDQKLDAVVEKLDHKLGAIANDQSELKISLGRVEERLSGFDQRLGTLKERSASQENRLWTLIAGVILALSGLLAKMTFFPTGQI
jgi:uncharacterized coiled-coil protein SlyX